MTEAWLRGPVEGVPARLMPVAHSLIDALEEIEQVASDLSVEEIWLCPGGAASVGFHLRHAAGSLDRLLTYAGGRGLSAEQRTALDREREPGQPPSTARELLDDLRRTVSRGLDTLRSTPDIALDETREVGRAKLPSTVHGLLFHAAEHTRRHAGQVIATARIIRGLGLGPG